MLLKVCEDKLINNTHTIIIVNPGGWVPAAAARAIYKHEYPKFLKFITQYILRKCEHKPLTL
jgi:hypothetical protein